MRADPGYEKSKAVLVAGARHPRVLQLGRVDLFARGTKSWVEEKRLPREYVAFEDVD